MGSSLHTLVTRRTVAPFALIEAEEIVTVRGTRRQEVLMMTHEGSARLILGFR